MEVRMEQTAGLGHLAEVWVDGHSLTVCDSVSTAIARCQPGVLENVTFRYVTDEGFAWSDAILGNPGRRTDLCPVRGWGYVGYGQIMQVMPVVVNFGLLTMEDANWSTDEKLVGRYVKVSIDRLDIVPASAT
jgi:hypothetical protein